MMAHAALVDEKNIVKDVHCINNDFLPNNGEFSKETEVAVNEFQNDLGLTPPNHRWLLTSYNDNFRGRYAVIGGLYDEKNDEFIPYFWEKNDGKWTEPQDWSKLEDNVSKYILDN